MSCNNQNWCGKIRVSFVDARGLIWTKDQLQVA